MIGTMISTSLWNVCVKSKKYKSVCLQFCYFRRNKRNRTSLRISPNAWFSTSQAHSLTQWKDHFVEYFQKLPSKIVLRCMLLTCLIDSTSSWPIAIVVFNSEYLSLPWTWSTLFECVYLLTFFYSALILFSSSSSFMKKLRKSLELSKLVRESICQDTVR